MDARYQQKPADFVARSAMREVLSGRRRGLSALMPFAGPAIVVSVAYLDPGNFATNIQAGARYGYELLWVVLVANLIAMLFQAMSAKLGIVTGRNLAELCRDDFPQPLVILMWIVSEVAAMATDLAEFLGGAIGLSLIFHLPVSVAVAVMAIVTYGLLCIQGRGFRRTELTIGALVGLIGCSYVAELFIVPVAWGHAGWHLLIPMLPDIKASALAAGIVGATVMPHALFLHSGLTQSRFVPATEAERRIVLRYSNLEVIFALTVAGAINIAMVIMAAAAFQHGRHDAGEIETAYHSLGPLLGRAAAAIFLVSLIASGISSSVVGTMAGQLVMQGFLRRTIPLWLRRAITMVPSIIVIYLGFNVTQSLVLSQIVLCMALPFPMLALIWFNARTSTMGQYRSSALTTWSSGIAAMLVLALDFLLSVHPGASIG